MNKSILLLRRFFLLFLIPLTELMFLRFVISKEEIYKNLILIFSPGLIFYSIIPIVITFFVFMLLLEKKGNPFPFTFQKEIFAINILSLAVFLTVNLNLESLASVMGHEWLSLIWYTLGVMIFSSSFFIFLNFKGLFERIKSCLNEAVFSLFAGSLFCLFHFSINYLWPYFSKIITFPVYGLLKLMGLNVAYGADGYTLEHPLFTASIGAPCSGLEGIFLFIFLFSLVLLLDWGNYSKKKAVAIYLVGIVFMLILNILRVSAFFMAAIWSTQKWGPSEASHLFVWFFHANVGWIFYALGIALFFSILFKFRIGRRF